MTNIITALIVVGTIIIVGIFVLIPMLSDFSETLNSNPDCIKGEREAYCKSIGMKFATIQEIKGGVLGDIPFDKDVCYLGEDIREIKHDDIDWSKCKK